MNLVKDMKNRKERADYFLYDCGLLEELKKYGNPHIIGSYRMDLMACNDLDIDIENDMIYKGDCLNLR